MKLALGMVFVIQVATLTALGGLWLLDVAEVVADRLYNGFFYMSAKQGFHVGLWMAIGGNLVTMAVSTALIILVVVRR